MIIRFSDRIEVALYDKFNWGVFRVMPIDFDNSKSKLRESEDGRALRHTGTYHGTCADACRKAAELLFRDGIADPACDSVARACDETRIAVSAMADAIGAAVKSHG